MFHLLGGTTYKNRGHGFLMISLIEFGFAIIDS